MIHFDIEWKELEKIGDELQATNKQVRAAYSRALQRTASKLRVLSSKGLTSELQLRRATLLRKRLKSLKFSGASKKDGVKLWYGLNDMPVSWFKGTPKKTRSGASFRGKEFEGAFVGKSKFKKMKTVLKRTTKKPLPIVEQLMPVQDQAQVFVEDTIFVQVEDIFWPEFKRELAARVKFNIGEK